MVSRGMEISYLEALLAPLPPEEAFQRFARDESFEGRFGSSVAALSSLPFLQSPEALLALWPARVKAQYPKTADEVSSIEVDTSEAKNLFDNGFCLLFEDAHLVSKVLEDWLMGLRKELGLSALTQSRCLLYATPKGKGTAPHFDQNANFILQMSGTKKWWLADNESVVNPLSRHTIGQPVDAELETYLDSKLPAAMPEKRREITLTAGSLLFVPRGMWHTTEALADALSLNFTYSAPAWLDLLCAALRSRLALSAEWRATAVPSRHSEPKRRLKALSTFEGLLETLTQDLPHWNASDILQVTESEESLNK
jgi:50S ribosomal protein L16 3-hydroxylase